MPTPSPLRRRARTALRLAVVALAAAGAAGCAATRSPDAVAEFASREVTCADLRAFAATQPMPAGATSGSDLVQEYVLHALLLAEVERGGLEADPEVERRFRTARRDLLLESSAAAVAGVVSVSDDEVAAFQAATAAGRDTPARETVARLILRRLPESPTRAETAAGVALLDDVQARFLSGASFDELAGRYSEHPSAAHGGAVDAAAAAELGAPFARVLAGLEVGELSDVVRLPQGLALVLKDRSAPAVAAPAAAADDAFAARARLLLQRRAELTAAAVTEARRTFRVRVDDTAIVSTADGYADQPVAWIGDEALSLRELGLENRPPFLREAVQRALDDELLVRLAAERADPATQATLARLRADTAAEVALERLVRSQVPAVREGEMMALYATDKDRFLQPERRVFEVVRIAAESGELAEAWAAAEAIARIWRPGGPIHQRNRAEVWGPITAEDLAAATSAELAHAAFALAEGATSAPLPVEPTADPPTLGYVLLRPQRIDAAGPLPYEEARVPMERDLEAPRLEAARQRVRAELLQRAGLRILPPMFDCAVTPAPAAGAPEP